MSAPPCTGPAPPQPLSTGGPGKALSLGLGLVWGSHARALGVLAVLGRRSPGQGPSSLPTRWGSRVALAVRPQAWTQVAGAVSERHPEMTVRLVAVVTKVPSRPRDTVLKAPVHAGAWGASLPTQAARSSQLPLPRPQAPRRAWGVVLDQTPGGFKGLGSVSPRRLVTKEGSPTLGPAGGLALLPARPWPWPPLQGMMSLACPDGTVTARPPSASA